MDLYLGLLAGVVLASLGAFLLFRFKRRYGWSDMKVVSALAIPMTIIFLLAPVADLFDGDVTAWAVAQIAGCGVALAFFTVQLLRTGE
jgi:hypothetical protein